MCLAHDKGSILLLIECLNIYRLECICLTFQNVLADADFSSVSETISVDQTVTQVFRLRPYQDVYVNVVDPKVCLCSGLEYLWGVISTLPQD